MLLRTPAAALALLALAVGAAHAELPTHPTLPVLPALPVLDIGFTERDEARVDPDPCHAKAIVYAATVSSEGPVPAFQDVQATVAGGTGTTCGLPTWHGEIRARIANGTGFWRACLFGPWLWATQLEKNCHVMDFTDVRVQGRVGHAERITFNATTHTWLYEEQLFGGVIGDTTSRWVVVEVGLTRPEAVPAP